MIEFLTAWFSSHLTELRNQDRERGASTVEWVIITVCLIAVAVGLAVLITNVINERSTGIF